MKSIWVVAATLCLSASAIDHASASADSEYRCSMGNGSAIVKVVPEEGRAYYEDANSRFSMKPYQENVYANEAEEISLEMKGRRATLWFGDASFPCESVFAQPIAHGQAEAINAVGQSLGGKLRDGPGTNFRQIGSVAEGTWLTILNNTNVRFDGYDWFEVVFDNGKRGYQWGGIMCSNGPRIEGIYSSCQNISQAPTNQSTITRKGRGFMAFAVGSDGRFGHGAGGTVADAERFAMQYCGEQGCQILDVTDAKCHALAQVPGGSWFGAGQNEQAARNFALGFCTNAGASGCKIEYTHCQ
ncbi:DUF4189 domain-containing protein [Roseibium sp.]|uniref:DUF4189 domain-containing protein n=1 Tax=Roseibium sp. TaxID=1936156 RepID=UPI0032632D8A